MLKIRIYKGHLSCKSFKDLGDYLTQETIKELLRLLDNSDVVILKECRVAITYGVEFQSKDAVESITELIINYNIDVVVDVFKFTIIREAYRKVCYQVSIRDKRIVFKLNKKVVCN